MIGITCQVRTQIFTNFHRYMFFCSLKYPGNPCSSDMGILHAKPGDFQRWVKNNSDNLQHRFSWFRDPSSGPDGAGEECNHYPRAIMGEYLKTRFQEAAQLAQDMGLAIRL
jgi:hypothetical protein